MNAAAPPVRPSQARALRALAWGGLWFVLAQFLGGTLLDYVWPEVKFPAAERVLAVARSAPRVDVVAVGSSRMDALLYADELAQGLNLPHAIVVNLAVGAGDLVTAEYLYRQLRDQAILPGTLLIEISPETLAERNAWIDQHALRQLTWHDLPDFAGEMVRYGHTLRCLSARLVPLWTHRDQLRHRAWLAVAGMLDHQAVARLHASAPVGPGRLVDLERDAQLRRLSDAAARTQAGLPNIIRWLRDYRVGGQAARRFERLLTQATADGVRTVVIAVPLSSPHRALYTPPIEAAFQQYLHATLARFPQVEFHDDRARLPDHEFLDNHHASPTGGRQISRLWGERLRR